jgi:hypothetical protein
MREGGGMPTAYLGLCIIGEKNFDLMSALQSVRLDELTRVNLILKLLEEYCYSLRRGACLSRRQI